MSFAPEWLALREQADADARSTELLDLLGETRLNRTPLVFRDLGCGTGSMGRWLGARLRVAPHWVLHDRDPRLLELAGASMIAGTVETREGDLTALRADDLAGTSLVTASALLDLLTRAEVNELASACVSAGVPALFTLSVTGKIEFARPEALDAEFEAAFNAHQRRAVDGRRLLGPDAVAAAAEAFADAEVHTRPSPWRLGGEQRALAAEWLRGWVGAAVEHEPGLAAEAPAYLRRRLAEGPQVSVGHTDLLAIPRTS
ncbi:SAM-dependent methyltransferase [Amycolatopsis sp. cg5]|uniref:SAM-dependent methyltransferase n=1 Tax=Amycolatopsis sp. cg5 TaxID=3238802 RepID=UPI003525853A